MSRGGRPTEYHFPGAIASHCAYDPNGNLAKQAPTNTAKKACA
jgi:hypothetical protein